MRRKMKMTIKKILNEMWNATANDLKRMVQHDRKEMILVQAKIEETKLDNERKKCKTDPYWLIDFRKWKSLSFHFQKLSDRKERQKAFIPFSIFSNTTGLLKKTEESKTENNSTDFHFRWSVRIGPRSKESILLSSTQNDKNLSLMITVESGSSI